MTRPRVIGTVGCPGSGKSTYSLQFDPHQWVVLTSDDWRQALWPPHRRVYHGVRTGPNGKRASELLRLVHSNALISALDLGCDVVLADTHVRRSAFEHETAALAWFGIEPEWKVFLTPWETLEERNRTRPEDHRVPAEILRSFYDEMHAPDAWWRTARNVEIVS